MSKSWATFGTVSKSHSSSGVIACIVGATFESRIDSAEKIASIPPVAPNKCQVIDLVELTFNDFAASPNVFLIA